jgi:hypothetical protein
MGRTLRGQRQGTLPTLSQMLDPAASSSTNSNTSKLITLPNEVIFKIIGDKALTVFDRSCLMLTSKAAARIVNSSSADISIPTIQHGEEEFAVEMQMSAIPGYEESPDIDSDQDFEASFQECACEKRLCDLIGARIDNLTGRRLKQM